MEFTVDYDAARRQAFGSAFEPLLTDRQVADELMGGKLTLRPHPVWEIPDQILWNEDPFGQRNWVAQLHMLRWLEPVRRIALSGDERAKGYWTAVCKSWISANPVGNPKSPYAWGDMVDGIRAKIMVFALPMYQGEEHGWLTSAIIQHGQWLSDPANLGHSNHALHQHQGLLVCGLALGNREWISVATKRIGELFADNYDVQGVNAEGSIGYHKHNYQWWETAFRRFDVENIPRPRESKRLKLALEELAYATKPNLEFERIGDIDHGGPAGLKSPEIDYILSKGSLGSPPSENTKVYDAGYVFGRSGWGQFERDFSDELFYSVSFGSAKRVHGHPDGGSITLHSAGHPWLVDTGKYAYVKDAMRSYCLSRKGHNVIQIEDRPYDPASVVRLKRYELTPELDDFEFVDEGYQNVKLNRRVIYSRGGDFLVVIDTVRSPVPVTAHQRWHLDPGTQIEQTNLGFDLKRLGRSGSIEWRGKSPKLEVVRGAVQPMDGWIATEWMKKEPTYVLSATRHGDHFRMVTVIGATGHEAGVEFKSLEVERPFTLVKVRSGKQDYVVEIGSQGAQLRMGQAGAGSAVRQQGTTLKGLVALVQAELRSAKNLAPEAPEVFSPEYWGHLRTWIRGRENEREARLMGLERLLGIEAPKDKPSGDPRRLIAMVDLAGSDLTFEGRITGEALGIRREPLSVWSGSNNISPTYKMPRIDKLTEADFTDPKGAIWVRELGGLTLPIAVSRGAGDILSVRFHGAVDRTKTSLPLFQGLTSERLRGVSHAVIQDPTLDLDPTLRLGWYLGRKEINLHQYIASSIEEIKAAVGAEHVLLSGSSGGGFAALQVGAHLGDCVILAINPQTSVTNYHAAAGQRAINESFDGRPPEDTRISAVSTYRQLDRVPPVVYVQNVLDTHHLEFHMKPFKQAINGRKDAAAEQVHFVDVDWGKGHKSASGELYEEFWKKATSLFA